jgi:hypothetical protein
VRIVGYVHNNDRKTGRYKYTGLEMFLDYFALTLLIVVSLILIYAAIYIHDIPYEMAVKRNHPHQDAIHFGGWLSLFTLHAIWPFLWIWATLYKPGVGYGFGSGGGQSGSELANAVEDLAKTVEDLQQQVRALQQSSADEERT